MSGADDHRVRSQAVWREVMQADAPPVSDPYLEVTTDHLMGRIWTRPGLALWRLARRHHGVRDPG